MFVVRAVTALVLILGIAGMHASFGAPAMTGHAAVSMTGGRQTMAVQEVTVTAFPAVMTSPDSMSEIMQGIMHACMFLVAAAVLALLASPAFLIWGPQSVPRLHTLARRRMREPRGVDRTLALCVLRI